MNPNPLKEFKLAVAVYTSFLSVLITTRISMWCAQNCIDPSQWSVDTNEATPLVTGTQNRAQYEKNWETLGGPDYRENLIVLIFKSFMKKLNHLTLDC